MTLRELAALALVAGAIVGYLLVGVAEAPFIAALALFHGRR